MANVIIVLILVPDYSGRSSGNVCDHDDEFLSQSAERA